MPTIHSLVWFGRPGPAVPAASDNDSAQPGPDGYVECADREPAEENPNALRVSLVRESLERVLELLRPALVSSSHDETMFALTLSPNEFVEPLSKHEVIVLGCALYMERLGGAFAYSDVLELTDRFCGRAMNTAMVYKTILRLQERGLLESKGREVDERTERLSQIFAINEEGRMAFRLAVLNARLLEKSREKVAA